MINRQREAMLASASCVRLRRCFSLGPDFMGVAWVRALKHVASEPRLADAVVPLTRLSLLLLIVEISANPATPIKPARRRELGNKRSTLFCSGNDNATLDLALNSLQEAAAQFVRKPPPKFIAPPRQRCWDQSRCINAYDSDAQITGRVEDNFIGERIANQRPAFADRNRGSTWLPDSAATQRNLLRPPSRASASASRPLPLAYAQMPAIPHQPGVVVVIDDQRAAHLMP